MIRDPCDRFDSVYRVNYTHPQLWYDDAYDRGGGGQRGYHGCPSKSNHLGSRLRELGERLAIHRGSDHNALGELMLEERC